jgi:hypothetical protein
MSLKVDIALLRFRGYSENNTSGGALFLICRSLSREAACRTARFSGTGDGTRTERDATPDLNPIAQFSAKLKHLLRKAAARSVETICAAIGQILRAFTPDECANYFQNSGYAQT